MEGLVAEIALANTTVAYDRLYTYSVPPELYQKAEAGSRVLVPFGNGNIKKQGIIFAVKTAEIKGLKKILSVIDDQPVLTEEMMSLGKFMQESLFCTYYDAVSAMLPAGLSYKLVNYYSANTEFSDISLLSPSEKEVYNYLERTGERDEATLRAELSVTAELLEQMVVKEAVIKSCDAKRRMGDATQKWVRLCDREADLPKLTPRQTEVVRLLSEVGEAAVKEICYFTGVTASVVENLVKKGILISFEKQVFRTPYKLAKTAVSKQIVLSDEQNAAYEGLLGEYRSEKGAASLLYGVTGSGKTQVFLKLVDEVVACKRGVIVMVPEISLTPQLISIFTERYGNKIAVFHSAMSMGQRMDEWQRIRDGRALIAVGTRSAVFAPFKDLGLIIIDEEQEHTYKSEKSPRFHARDLARYRTAYHKGLLCMASATPSVETFTAAKNGRYSLFTLKNRYGNAVLPTVETVDMRLELRNGNKGIISNLLYNAISDCLEEKKQAILLLNRRGHNTYVSCPECGYVATCPNCSVSLTYHSANNRLMCHYCGHSQAAERVCPECGCQHMRFSGLGTQKAEEELKLLFPDAEILRLDADSTMTRDSYASYLGDFAKGKYNILLGTQMVAKGLDFSDVTLVGVLGADRAMFSEDYRGFERTFSLLTQVVGRAGRGENQGRAIIQTIDPESNLIGLAQRQDYDTFYSEEILTRKLMVYPPYCDICVISTQSENRETAQSTVEAIFASIKQLLEGEFSDIKIIILGPTPAAVPKVNNRYRYRMMIKCKNNVRFRKMLRCATEKAWSRATVTIDFNPETII
ncbi:MAG: primosomal protein N' [Clostridia bacterium]|nr:primosomal protein N' [Clostridia bacterium]